MNAKQLERFLADRGANASAVDVVVRKLRESFKLSTAGRGLSAHKLDGAEIVWVLTVYAGSETAARADETLARLSNLIAPAFRHKHIGNDFLSAVQVHFRNGAEDIREIRIGRNINMAVIVFNDGVEEVFVDAGQHGQADLAANAYRSEGVLSGGLLKQLAAEIGSL